MSPLRWLLVAILVLVAAALVIIPLTRPVDRHDGRGIAVTISRLEGLWGLAEMAEDDLGPAPVESAEVVRFIAKHSNADRFADIYDEVPLHHSIDLDGERIVDYWGQSVVVVAVEGRVWAFVSPGENGIWEDGKGDDIVVTEDGADYPW